MNPAREHGVKIIRQLGTGPYLLWRYLIERNFVIPTMNEMEQHFGRNQRTIRGWLKNLEEHGYTKLSA